MREMYNKDLYTYMYMYVYILYVYKFIVMQQGIDSYSW